ncbi:MAG: HrpE/YscL family type III secretion apparatus protein [Planctomycetota bacterium]
MKLQDGVALRPDGKRIPAALFQAHVRGQDIIAEAERQAEEIRKLAERERQQQREEGYAEGLREGRLEMAERMVDSVSKSVDYFSGLEEQMTEIVMKALRKILGEMDDKERVLQVVRSALGVARNQTNVTLRVPPSEAEVARSRLDEIMQPYPGIRFLEITAESRLKPGECILETELGVVDAGLETQLAAIENSLRKSFASS